MPRNEVTVSVPEMWVWGVAELAALVGLSPKQLDRRIDHEHGVCHVFPDVCVPIHKDPTGKRKVLFYRNDVLDAFALAGRILHPSVS